MTMKPTVLFCTQIRQLKRGFEGENGDYIVDQINIEYYSFLGFMQKYPYLEPVVVLNDQLTEISSNLLNGFSNLREITIPSSVTTIERFAFSHCALLSELIIPDSVTSIGCSAFNWCISLTKLVIPDS